eukprot:Sspe_Gene.73589::Locus_44544_Transcript_1_1_Confidence_1.000_Length_626::g.73589::m.73589
MCSWCSTTEKHRTFVLVASTEKQAGIHTHRERKGPCTLDLLESAGTRRKGKARSAPSLSCDCWGGCSPHKEQHKGSEASWNLVSQLFKVPLTKIWNYWRDGSAGRAGPDGDSAIACAGSAAVE